MKILMGTAVLLALMAGSARAADLPARPVYKAAPMAPMVTATSWTGFYIGVEGGYGWGDQDTVVTDPSGNNFNVGDRFASGNPKGWLVGLAAGADYQTGPWVFGIKGSYDWANIKGDTTTVSTVFPSRDIHSHAKLDWIAMATGRLGYTVTPDALLYVVGGWAWAGSERTSETVFRATNAVLSTTSGSETLDGWTIGVGAEYRFVRNVSLVLQYNYIDFGEKNTSSNVLTGPTAGNTVGRNSSTTLNVVKAGLNYRF